MLRIRRRRYQERKSINQIASYSGSKDTEVLAIAKRQGLLRLRAIMGKTLVVDDLYGAIYHSLPSAATFPFVN